MSTLHEAAATYMREVAEEWNAPLNTPEGEAWLESEAKALAEHLARATEGYMNTVADPPPGGDE